MMSGKQFFIERYAELGWNYTRIQARQAIRLNETNVKGKNLVERLSQAGLTLQKVSFLESGYWVSKSRVSAGATAEYLLGYYSMQEAAAQIPATLFSTLKGKAVLDASAAPGGKTVQLADLMQNTGTITALDVNKQRLAALANHLERCHVSNTAVYNLDARKASSLKMQFDRILLDVPCSGNFASDPQWFNRRTLRDVERNVQVQREILSEAAKCLAPNGEMVYSTCSLEPEEDELNMDWAVNTLGLRIEEVNCLGAEGLTAVFGRRLHASVSRCRRIWPAETQGFFVCRLSKQEMQP